MMITDIETLFESEHFMYYAVAAIAGLVLIAGPLLKGIGLTVDFLGSLSKSKKHGSIDRYNNLHGNESSEERNKEYADLVSSYYDLATEFYEWGWGTSFHFSDKRKGENFKTSILRHEHYLAGRLGVAKGAKILDCGCGVGGPARNIARFTGAQVTAVTINPFQVQRGNALCKKEGCDDMVKLEKADFMKLPYPDNSFDGVYAIEATCHAPDRHGVYSEILRVLKPGGVFATYEWCLTDKYDPNNAYHRKIKKDIEVGDGLPDMCHTSVCTKALEKVGFDVVEARDYHLGADYVEPWFRPLTPGWNPFVWPRFQFNPIMFKLMPIILSFFELIRLVPQGTSKTQVMLQAGGVGCEQGGATGVFTPMWLMVGRKPGQKKYCPPPGRSSSNSGTGIVMFSLAFAVSEEGTTTRTPKEVDSSVIPVAPGYAHFSGYLEFDVRTTETVGVSTFYYYVQHPDPYAPLLIWMNGGPGASSLMGLLTEIGPNLLNGKSIAKGNDSDIELLRNPYAWTSNASVLVWEQPAGVGFSRCTKGHATACRWNDTTATDANVEALHAFYDIFPNALYDRSLYIVGESYAGIYVPLLASRLMQDSTRRKIPLRGVAIGNGCIGYGVAGACGLDSLDLFVSVLEEGAPGTNRDTLAGVRSACVGELDKGLGPEDLTSTCRARLSGLFREVAEYDQYSYGSPCPPGETGNWGDGAGFTCGASGALSAFLNSKKYQIALNVIGVNASTTKPWQAWDGDWPDYEIIMEDAQPYYRELLDGGIPVWIYNGLRDTAVPWIGALKWIPRVAGSHISSPRRLWGLPKSGGVAIKGGHVTVYETGLVFVAIDGAGHLVPAERPDLAAAMISAFLNGEEMPAYEGETCQRLWTGRGYGDYC